jgi:hypothetical protein
MQALLGLPLWAMALVAAAFVPFAARAWGATVERRVRERSVRLLAGSSLSRRRATELGGSSARDARSVHDGEARS